jgi:hypothetical protein
VQCGNETKTVSVAQVERAVKMEGNGDVVFSVIVPASMLAFIALMAIASFYIAGTYLSGSARFCKSVQGGKARLELRAGRKMERAEISDPVCIGRKGDELRFSIPKLEAGSEWSFEYGMDCPKRALPASLSADVSGKRVSMLSELFVDEKEREDSGRKKGVMKEAEFSGSMKSTAPPHAPENSKSKPKRKLPRA